MDTRHPTAPLGADLTTRELGKLVSYLRYDQIQEFILGLIEGTDEQARADRGHGRKKLANELTMTGIQLNDLVKRFDEVIRVCGPDLQTEIAEHPAIRFSVIEAVSLCERLLLTDPARTDAEEVPAEPS